MVRLFRRAMKIILIFSAFLLVGFNLKGEASTKKTEFSEKKLNLLTDTKVENPVFTVTAPRGWSYLRLQSQKPKGSVWVKGKAVEKMTNEIMITSNSDSTVAKNFVAIRDAIPGIISLPEIIKQKGQSLDFIETVIWGHQLWEVLKYETKDQSGNGFLNWLATANVRGRKIILMASVLSTDEATLRPVIEEIMSSTRVNLLEKSL
jgi:hypothetical protein